MGHLTRKIVPEMTYVLQCAEWDVKHYYTIRHPINVAGEVFVFGCMCL